MLGDKPILPWYRICPRGDLPRETISAKWLRYFNELAVGGARLPNTYVVLMHHPNPITERKTRNHKNTITSYDNVGLFGRQDRLK